MLKGAAIALVSTAMKQKTVWLGMLLVLVLILPLLACAVPTSTATPIPTPSPAQTPTPPATAPTPTPPTPAAFQIADLLIVPAEVNPGDEVVISAKVTNIGGVDGVYDAELMINDIAEAVTKVTVATDETRIVSFSMSKETPGAYEVAFGELAGQFVVAEPVATQPNNPNIAPAPTVPPCCR
jgi:hypothetical protein